eukprot:SAG31_NODE_2645_length_5313_cov_6.731300_3_plen_74_part_00
MVPQPTATHSEISEAIEFYFTGGSSTAECFHVSTMLKGFDSGVPRTMEGSSFLAKRAQLGPSGPEKPGIEFDK